MPGAIPPMALTETARPDDLAQVVGQPTREIESLIQSTDTPNYLLYGPPGTGKTTVARCIARELHTNTEPLYELNASDDRGIDAVREIVDEVAHTLTITGNPPVILLDEADSMTRDAQQALRRPMEDAPAVFILTGNDLSGIHDAVQSRCQTFEFARLPPKAIETRLHEIARELEATDVDCASIAHEANGDMRKALNKLERKVKFGSESRKAEKVKEYINA